MEKTLALGAELLVSTGVTKSTDAGRAQLQQTIDSGAAREKFAEMVRAQGGDLDAPRPVAPGSELTATRAGYVTGIDAEELGRAIIAMGGGRQQLGDKLDHSTGIEMLVRLGDQVAPGQPIVRVFAKPDVAAKVKPMLLAAVQIADHVPPANPLILERLS
jgi:thymidine phosphorylase